MTDVLWHCPVHGLSPAIGMAGGVWCLEEDPERPENEGPPEEGDDSR